MKLPYGDALSESGEPAINKEKAEVVRLVFGYYLSSASLGKVAFFAPVACLF